MVIGTVSGEGMDRGNLSLAPFDEALLKQLNPFLIWQLRLLIWQLRLALYGSCEPFLIWQALLKQVAAAQPRTVAVVVAPGAVLLPWLDDVGAALLAFMPGQEVGHRVRTYDGGRPS